MPKKCLTAIFLSLSFLSCVLAKENIPEPNGWVNDFASVLSDEYEQKLNSLISDLEQKTRAEIAVVTIQSISPYDEAGYARLLFDKWRPGKKGKDNGVLVLLAIKERAWRIETGYGIEAILPDGLCGEIGRNYMVPYFKQGRYEVGLYGGIIKIAQVIAKDAGINLGLSEVINDVPLGKTEEGLPLPAFLLLIIFVIFIHFLNYLQRRSGFYSSGGSLYGRRYGGLGGSGFGGGFSSGGFGGGFGGGGGAGGKF